MKNKKPVITTHSAGFHVDDIFAVATLKILLGDVKIIRSRDKEDIEKADYVVDVGREYDPKENKFDHHQGDLKKRENKNPYASFGLVWKKYGENICDSKDVAKRVDEVLVQPIDMFDNGKQLYKNLYEGVHPYTIESIIDAFNANSDEEDSNDEHFKKALPLVERIIKREIKRAKIFVKERERVLEVYKKSKDKRILFFDHPISWLNTCEIIKDKKEPIFIVKPTKDENRWQAKSILEDRHFFEARRHFPDEWGGKAGKELQKVTEVEDAVFCHRVPFIIVAESKEGILELTKKALEE